MEKFADLAGLKRSERPNNYFSAPKGLTTRSDADVVSPVFELPAADLAVKAFGLWRGLKRVELKSVSDDGLSAHFIATTALMRFRDDIWVQCIALDETKSSLFVYSASRVGYSDLGTNAKRVKDWLDKLQLLLKGA